MASATPRTRRVIAGVDPSTASSVDSPAPQLDPAHGARRREGFLLSAYAVLFLIAVWTVVVAELMPEPSDTSRRGVEARASTGEPAPVAGRTQNP